jgi:hypothetical protein
MHYRALKKPSTASLMLVWLLNIAGIVLLFATTGVLHYLGLGLVLGTGIASIWRGLRLWAVARERPKDQEP